MSQAHLNRAASVGLAGATVQHLAAGAEVELISHGFSQVRVNGSVGWVETSSLDAGASPPRVEGVVAFGVFQSTQFQGRNFIGAEVVVDAPFASLLEFVDASAGDLQLRVHVTSSLRRKDAAVVGAIVPPAQRSNHLVGHAIDMNVELGGTLFNSVRLAKKNHGTLPRPILEFLNRIRSHGVLRWGGDFVTADPVHIDDDLARRDPAAWQRKFASL